MFSHTVDGVALSPMTRIVRVAIVAVTLALFLGSTLNVLTGQRDIAVIFALATPLGISAWGFARAGHNEAALVLLCCVLIAVVTLVLVLNPLGVHAVAITAYGGIVGVGALLLSRRSFGLLVLLTVASATAAFVLDLYGLSRSRIAEHSTWTQWLEFIVIIGVFALMGRVGSEILSGSVGDAHRAAVDDPVTGLANRPGFLARAGDLLRGRQAEGSCGVLVLGDLDAFRRMNVVIGHRAADGVLMETGKRLSAMMGDHLRGRIGDDEFAVLVTGLPDEAACERVARDVHKVMSFDFSGVSVRSSVGFARFPRDANGIESLLLAAEGSLTRAKDHQHEAERFAGPSDRI
jgi:diguanylate cyclase (GGDEF)-like protein